MFFADFTPKYYLVDADYNENNGLSIQEKSKIVIKNYRKEIKEFCKYFPNLKVDESIK